VDCNRRCSFQISSHATKRFYLLYLSSFVIGPFYCVRQTDKTQLEQVAARVLIHLPHLDYQLSVRFSIPKQPPADSVQVLSLEVFLP
jgi:hypothetical protein